MPSLDELVQHWGYAAIALLVLLGNIGVPVPEETILALGGYMAWQGQLRVSLVLAVGIVSAVTGDSLGYWMGRRRGPQAIERYAQRWVGGPGVLDRTRAFVRRRGMLAVFVARFVPGLRFLAGPIAGATGMRFEAFAIANVLGAVVYVPLVTAAGWGVGYGLGDHLARLRDVIGALEHVVLAAVVLAIVGTLGLRAIRALRGARSREQ
jgi:membrane protein DedA with SNARE-associated domain